MGCSKSPLVVHDKAFSLGLCLGVVLALAALLAKDIGEPYVQDWDEGLYLCQVREALNGQPFFTSIYNGQAPAFLDILTLSMRIFGESVVVARATILFFYLLSLAGVGWISWRVACPLAAPVAMVLLSLSLMYFRQSTVVQAEIMSLSFALLSIGLLLSSQDRSRLWLLLAGFLFTLVLLLPPLAVAASANTLWVASAIARGGKLIGSVVLFVSIAIVFFMLKQDFALLAAKQSISQSEREVIRLIRQNTQESDFVVSDEHMHVFLSGRRMPAWLCDSADNRIKSRYLSDEEAIQASENARMVIFATRRLAMLRGYVRWVEANYDLIGAFENPATKVYLRRGSDSRQVAR